MACKCYKMRKKYRILMIVFYDLDLDKEDSIFVFFLLSILLVDWLKR